MDYWPIDAELMGLKELRFIFTKKDFLVDSDGVKYKRPEPVVTLKLKVDSPGCVLTPNKCRVLYGQQILDLQKEGKLVKGWYAVNAYFVAGRRDIDVEEAVAGAEAGRKYRFLEELTTEFYFLGEK
jgi:hypothetical protein